MGTTFVSLAEGGSTDSPGFWMRDTVLELWLRLLALHLPDPDKREEREVTLKIRDGWLLASRGCFTGCVPHGMENACATKLGQSVVRKAIDSLLAALKKSEAPLDADTLNLLGIESGEFTGAVERKWLLETGYAFLDLLDGKSFDGPASTEIMPGTKPYTRRPTRS